MRKIIFILIFFAGCFSLNGQPLNWQWAIKAGGHNDDQCFDVVTDSYGNSYITGYIAGQGPGMGSSYFGNIALEYEGLQDIFVAKLDANGNWIWAVSAGGDGYDSGMGIALDNIGNCYVSGYFSDTVFFGPDSLTSNGYMDIFVAKLDSNGNWLWAKRAGGDVTNGADAALDICTDNYGNSYVTGYFIGAADFGTHYVSSAVGKDPFIAKIDTNGNWLWARSAFGLEHDDIGNGISFDDNGNCYVTGYFSNSIYFGPTNLTTANYMDGFVAKLGTNGNWIWAKSIGGSWAEGYDIATSGNGNSYITGCFKGSVVLDTISLSIYADYSNSDVLIAKIDANGNWLWAKRAGGTHYDEGRSICLDNSLNCYVTGFCNEAADFGNTVLGYNDGASLVFVTKLDTNGNWQWAEGCGGTFEDIGYGITTDNSGDILVAGRFSEMATFGDFTLTSTGWYYSWDIFTARLSSEVENIDEITPHPASQYQTEVYPNPCRQNKADLNLDFIGEGFKNINHAQLIICNLKGQAVYRQTLTNTDLKTGIAIITHQQLSSGIYLLSIKDNNVILSTKKLSVIR